MESEAQIEEPLHGGQASVGVVRVGSTVRRWPAPNADFAHELLGLLAEAQFAGAPRYLGLDEKGREILSFIDGWIPQDLRPDWSDEQLAASARLLRRFHDATSGTKLAGRHETVRHGDVNPTNVVWREGLPVAFLDFDHARPGLRIGDVAYMCWTFVLAVRAPSDELSALARRLRIIRDAYGLSERMRLVDAILEEQAATKALVAITSREPRSKRSEADVSAAISGIEAEMSWLRSAGPSLAAALT